MKTIYSLTVRPSVRIPAGNLHINVGVERTYWFASIDERQIVLDWCRSKGWDVSCNLDHTMTAKEVQAEIRQNIKRSCEPFHHPVPAELIA